MILKGKVISGSNKAGYFTQLPWVQEQCDEKLGFRPFPGTLNLELSDENMADLKSLHEKEGLGLIPPDTGSCSAGIWPVTIGGYPGAIVIPGEEVRIHGRNVLEVIAPLRLKDALHVDDGDWLTLEITLKQP